MSMGLFSCVKVFIVLLVEVLVGVIVLVLGCDFDGCDVYMLVKMVVVVVVIGSEGCGFLEVVKVWLMECVMILWFGWVELFNVGVVVVIVCDNL